MEIIWFLNKTENVFLFPIQVLSVIHIKFSHISPCIFNSQFSLIFLKKQQNPNLFYIENCNIFSYVNLSSDLQKHFTNTLVSCALKDLQKFSISLLETLDSNN